MSQIPASIAFASIAELGVMLREGTTSPTELARLFIDRLDTIGRRLNAVVTITADRALREAENAERELAVGIDRGPLHGIPYGAKDLLASSGIPTSWGAAPLRDRIIEPDATAIERLQAAGAVLVAKTAMAELAGGMGYNQPNASFTGPAKNPWNETAWAGGSSNGTAASVAAGCIPFGIGSETVGSIINPAGYCGVSGLCPTYGQASRYGAMALAWTLDKPGPIARVAADCGIVLEAISGSDSRDPATFDAMFQFHPDSELSSGFRLAVLRQGLDSSQPEVHDNFERSLRDLSKWSTLEEIDLPEYPYYEAAHIINRSEASAALEELFVSGQIHELTAPEDRVGGYANYTITAVDYLRAQRVRTKIMADLDALLAQYDGLVHPSFSMVASPLNMTFEEYRGPIRWSALASAANLAGLPMITVPNGFGQRNLPTAMQIVGRAGSESRILAVARSYQRYTDWHEYHPEC